MADSNSTTSATEGQQTTLPLTREQEALWVEWKLSPVGNSYNTCIQMRLEGELSVPRFRRAIADVVAKFDLLRAYCVEVDDRPMLQLAQAPFELDVVDLTDGTTTETPGRHRQAITELQRRRDAAIDLKTFPLIRAALVQTAPQTFYFIGVVPHIISDGYAAVAILEAISTAYNDGTAGLRTAYPDDQRGWQDYLRLRADQPAAERQAAAKHWQEVLDGAQHIVPICHTARQLEAGLADTRGARYFLSFGIERLKRFNRLARSRRTSVFAVFAALYATLLYRQTSQTDLIIVFPVNVRPPGFRQTFGLFVNMLPLRLDLSGNPTFAELVEQIGQRRREDKPHQHLPGLDIVRARREQVSGFDGRLSNVSMGQTVSRFRGLDIPGVHCTALDNDAIHVRDDLSLMYEVGEVQVGLWLEYRTSAFTAAEVAHMAERLLRIVEAADADPNVRIGSIPLLDHAAEQAVLDLGRGPQWPVTPAAYGSWFESCARRHAERIAIDDDAQAITYAELERWSRHLAARLSIRPGPVAIVMDRSPAQLVTLLAALRSGAPYVPLMPNQGAVRLDAILEELQPAWLVSEPELLTRLRLDWRAIHLTPATRPPEPLSTDTDEPDRVDPTAPAYVIYTSGSTGTPKGVQVSHAALAYRLDWLTTEFPLQPGEAVLQNTSFAFDVSVAEILWPLTAGAKLVLSEPRQARDPGYLRKLIERHRISTVLMVPSALRTLLPESAHERSRLGCVRRILCAGEPLNHGLAEDVLSATNAKLFNVYGPTEAVIYATCREILPTDRAITIGRPIAHTSVAVVNDHLCLQPIGVPGELCIGGPGLADGYWQQPGMTRASFIEGVIDGGRWYRTGDRVCLSADGELTFLGRSDGQIKLRGHRIELGEIEHVLRSQPGVTDAVVMATPPTGGGPQQLIAWASCADRRADGAPPPGHCLAAGHWRKTLGRQLPDYMIPNRLLWLLELPRLPSGKLDAARLPALESVRITADDTPMNDQERAAATIWAEVLGIPLSAINRHSNFFELGGDSLMLIALSTRLGRIGLYLDVAELFEQPTIAGAIPLARTEPRELIDQSPVQGNFPLLPRQRKFFADGFAYPAHWNRSFVVSFSSLVNAEALQCSLEAVMRHHDILRASFPVIEHRRCMRVHAASEAVLPLRRYDLTGVGHADRRGHVIRYLDDLNANLDLAAPPLLRAVLFEEEERATLGLVIHHLLIDMRSCQILLEDLADAYRAQVSHRPQHLPARTTSAAEWSERLEQMVDRHWQADEVPFWARQLERVGHPLPLDHPPAGTAVEADQRTLEDSLDAARTQHLIRTLCVEAGVGVHEILLAAFADAFRETTGSAWLVVNTCGVGRETRLPGVDLSRTVGELNTVFPLAIDLQQHDMLKAVHCAYKALPAQGQNYGLLRYLAGHPELDRTEPEVFFNYVSRLAGNVDPALGMSVDMAPDGVQTSHPANRSCYALYLEGFVLDERLVLHLGYDSATLTAATAKRLLDGWLDGLVRCTDGPASAFVVAASGPWAVTSS